jgi:hypothetical protein
MIGVYEIRIMVTNRRVVEHVWAMYDGPLLVEHAECGFIQRYFHCVPCLAHNERDAFVFEIHPLPFEINNINSRRWGHRHARWTCPKARIVSRLFACQ